jgi:hypothetical protein
MDQGDRMPRELLEALEILRWLENEWNGEFDWDAGNEWKPAKRAHTVEQIEEAFEEFVFAGEFKAYDSDTWKETERRFGIVSQISGKDFRITFTVRGNKIRYVSHRRVE